MLLSDGSSQQHTFVEAHLADCFNHPLPTSTVCAPLPNVGEPTLEMPLSCVHCRLPLTLEVCRCGSLKDLDAFVVKDSANLGRHAYATLLYGSKAEYFLGALVIGSSLKASGSVKDRVLLHTDDVPEEYLQTLGEFWILRQVQYLEGSPKMYKEYKRSRFKAVFTKLQALTVIEYEKVLMLDLDMLIRKNIDELLELRAPASMKRSSGKEQPEHGGTFSSEDIWRRSGEDMCSGINAGVMLLQPDLRVYERMVAEIMDDKHPEHVGTYGPEQDYLSRFYAAYIHGEWTHLHARFNYQLMLPNDYVSSAHRAINVERDVAVAHYSGPRVKPWELSRGTALDVEGVRWLLESERVQAPEKEPSRSGQTRPRERVMDGVLVVETQNSGLPPEVQDVMWEWTLALRACDASLRTVGIDLVAVIERGQRVTSQTG